MSVPIAAKQMGQASAVEQYTRKVESTTARHTGHGAVVMMQKSKRESGQTRTGSHRNGNIGGEDADGDETMMTTVMADMHRHCCVRG